LVPHFGGNFFSAGPLGSVVPWPETNPLNGITTNKTVANASLSAVALPWFLCFFFALSVCRKVQAMEIPSSIASKVELRSSSSTAYNFQAALIPWPRYLTESDHPSPPKYWILVGTKGQRSASSAHLKPNGVWAHLWAPPGFSNNHRPRASWFVTYQPEVALQGNGELLSAKALEGGRCGVTITIQKGLPHHDLRQAGAATIYYRQ